MSRDDMQLLSSKRGSCAARVTWKPRESTRRFTSGISFRISFSRRSDSAAASRFGCMNAGGGGGGVAAAPGAKSSGAAASRDWIVACDRRGRLGQVRTPLSAARIRAAATRPADYPRGTRGGAAIRPADYPRGPAGIPIARRNASAPKNARP